MPRRYKVGFEGVAVSAAQDLVQINGGAGKMVRVLRAWAGATDTTAPTAQMLQIRHRFLPATVTNGTTGTTSATVAKTDQGDAAATLTAQTNCTGKATTSGTAVILEEDGFHVFSGYDRAFLTPPTVGPSTAYVFELLSTPSGTLHLSGGVEVEEIG